VKIKSSLIFIFFFATATYGQTKVIYGGKHIISIKIPKNWTQAPNRELNLYLKPNENVSVNTYMYVHAFDYYSNPDIDTWINEDIDSFTNKHPDVKVELMQINLTNLRFNTYQTGRYKIILYTLDNSQKQAVLVVECKNTITTVALSTVDIDQFNKYLPSFIEAIRSVRVLARDVKN
jgi:hypothetical protein